MKRTMHLFVFVICATLTLAAWPSTTLAAPVSDEPVIAADFGTASITWTAAPNNAGYLLVVSGPNGYRFEHTFAGETTLTFQAVDESGTPLVDGLYKYELNPIRYDQAKAQTVGDVGRDPSDSRELAQSQATAANLASVSGAFTIQAGVILDPNVVEKETLATAQPGQSDSPTGVDAPADQVIADDLIVQGSICTGFDCVDNENFGADTFRLKENNLRIHFDDTSNSGSFPSNDWRIVANDQSNGGASYLAIEDSTAGRTPFRVQAGAPSNSLYVHSNGNVGLGTASPVLDLHIVNGNTPAVRLEQDGTSGFTAQTWDVAANEANFFVRDITNGSQLPFKIQPGADSNSLTIESTNDVGVGTLSPNASLHVRRTDGTAQLLVEEASGTAGLRTLLHLKNNGNVSLKLERVGTAIWNIAVTSTNLVYAADGTGIQASRLEQNGNLRIAGTLTTGGPTCANGCREQGATFIESAALLEKLPNVPMIQWTTASSRADEQDPQSVSTVHLSPEMKAFYEIYGLGLDGQSIAPLDVATIALASVQALQTTVNTQNDQIAALEAQLAAMEIRMQRLEEMAHTHSYLPSISSGQ